MKLNLLPWMLLFSVFVAPLSTAHAQGTAFTYQGRLNTGGNPANGTYDFQFRLAADPLANTYIGSPYLSSGVAVSNGLFTAIPDFGPGILTGSNYWLEVDVRTNGAITYTALTPLQQLTPAPYAVFATSSSNLLGALPAGQLSGPIPNGNLPVSPSFSGTVTANTFAGNGVNVSNVNALTLNGLSSAGFWQLGGNNVSPGQFLGSTNNQPVEVWANGTRALRLEPGLATYGAPNVIGGSPANFVASSVVGATIAGGGATNYGGGQYTNSVLNEFGTIGGGFNNTAAGFAATVGGGAYNSAEGYYDVISGGQYNFTTNSFGSSVVVGGQANTNFSAVSFIGGGYLNQIQSAVGDVINGGYQNTIQFGSYEATIGGGLVNLVQAGSFFATIGGGSSNLVNGVSCTVAGGEENSASAFRDTVGGGLQNTASGGISTVSGGWTNVASGNSSTIGGGDHNLASGLEAVVPGGGNNIAGNAYTFAAGQQAQALHQGSFVWADSQNSPFASTANDQFNVRARGGVRFVTGGAGMTLDGSPVLISGGSSGITIQSNSDGAPNIISGSSINFVANGVVGATISGGGATNYNDQTVSNSVTADFGTVSGGYFNTASGRYATAGGGENNTASGDYSFAAGQQAQALHQGSFVWSDSESGAFSSTTNDEFSIRANNGVRISADKGIHLNANDRPLIVRDWDPFTTNAPSYKAGIGRWGLFMEPSNLTIGIPDNIANRFFQIAKYSTNGTYTTLVLVDQAGDLYATNNVFAKGVQLTSDRNAKEHFTPLNSESVLAKVAALPITQWNYKSDDANDKHIGPVAQDFHQAFGLNGADDKHISAVDESGVALSAIQGLNQEVEQLKTENAELKQRLAAIEKLIQNRK